MNFPGDLGDITLTSRHRINSDQPILDSSTRKTSLHILETLQKQGRGDDGHSSIWSGLGTSSSES